MPYINSFLLLEYWIGNNNKTTILQKKGKTVLKSVKL